MIMTIDNTEITCVKWQVLQSIKLSRHYYVYGHIFIAITSHNQDLEDMKKTYLEVRAKI